TASGFVRTPDTGTSAITTDQAEYWAFSSQEFPPQIDSATYITGAKNGTIASVPAGLTADANCIASPCTYLHAPPGPPVTVDASPAINGLTSGTTLYIEGSVVLNNLALDLQYGAIIIDGNLTLGTPGNSLGNTFTVHVASSAALEYPYWPTTGTQWFC